MNIFTVGVLLAAATVGAGVITGLKRDSDDPLAP
jgi:hypothetical protein